MGPAFLLAIAMPWAAPGPQPFPSLGASLDICHPLRLSRTPAVRGCGQLLKQMQALELRTLRHYFRPGPVAVKTSTINRIARDVEAIASDLSAYSQTSPLVAEARRCLSAWRLGGRSRAADVALLCDAAARLQEQIAASGEHVAARQDHFMQVLRLRGCLADLRRHRTWRGLSGRERDEILNAFQLWPRLAEEAMDAADALVARMRPRPPSCRHVLCALLLAYVRQQVKLSGKSMLRRGREILPRLRWGVWPEGTRHERRTATAAMDRIRCIVRRSAASSHVPLRLLAAAQQQSSASGRADQGMSVLQDRRVRRAVQAVSEAQAQGDF